MPDMIPLSIPNLGQAEQNKVNAALAAGWVSTAGPDIKQFEAAIAARCGVRFAVAMNSGTAALHLALRLSGVKSGDLVICPNITFVASINAVRYQGADPVLVDVRPDDWQMDCVLVEEFLQSQTEERAGLRVHIASGRTVRAILAVHVLGYPCDVQALADLAAQYGLALVEDAAEAMGSYLDGRHLGSFADLACLSFNGNKIMSSGGGGMLLTNDPRLAEHALHLSTQAKRHPDEYVHDELGFNYRMPNLAAALGMAQLGRLDSFVQRKKEIDAFYKEALASLEDLAFCQYREGAQPNHWMPTIRTSKARLLEEVLFIKGIQTRKLWLPMNRLPHFRECMYIQNENHSFQLYEDSLSLPCSTSITDAELETVALAIQDVFEF